MLSVTVTHERCSSLNQKWTFLYDRDECYNAIFHRRNLVCDEAEKDWIEIRVGNASYCVFPNIVVFECKC